MSENSLKPLSFTDFCENLKNNPSDERIWRAIFKDYLDSNLCIVIIKKASSTGKVIKEFLAVVVP